MITLYNKKLTFIFLSVFLLVFTMPFWKNMIKGSEIPAPVLQTTEKECVESREYMRSNHMKLLHEWRDDVVRKNNREYTNSQGITFNKSLTGTCLGCHQNKQQFCDSCHEAATVRLYCFDCHNDPQIAEKSSNEGFHEKQ